MDPITLLTKQTESAYAWTNKLLISIPPEKWDTTPDTVESNITWQTGHLIVSIYFHSILVITGHQMDILQQVPLKEYSSLFTNGVPANVRGKVKPSRLQQHLLCMQQRSLAVIKSLSPADLEAELVPSQPAHPIATNKYEALEWNIHHSMWHNGQIGLLKRIHDERFDFGLQTGG